MDARDDVPADDGRASIVDLIARLGAGERLATAEEAARLRDHFGQQVLPEYPNRRVLGKYAQHVEDDAQWPEDASPEDYLESLQVTVADLRSGVYLTRAEVEGTWTIYFVGRIRRTWRGRYAGSRVVVIFNAERPFWITGFQPEEGDDYVERQGGHWLQHPR